MRSETLLVIGVALLVYGGLGLAFGGWARAKGYGFALGLLMAIVCTPLAAAIVLLALPRRVESAASGPRLSAEEENVAAIAAAYKRIANSEPPPAS